MARLLNAFLRLLRRPIEAGVVAGFAAAALAFPLGAAVGPASAVQTLYLEVVLNLEPQPQLHRFELRSGRLFAEARALQGLGLAVEDPDDGGLVALDTLPGVSVDYRADRQRVELMVPVSALGRDRQVLGERRSGPLEPTPSARGALVNYQLYANHDGDRAGASLASELRLFGLGQGVVGQTQVSRWTNAPDGDGGWGTTRLDTHWRLSWPQSAVTMTVGDSFSGFLGWTRPVRLGGIQIGRNYGLQPYRITAPLPAFLGEAAVPSEVELYIDGMRQFSGSVPPGPFQLATVPGVSGAGVAQVVVTDAFGQVRTLDFPFYATEQLLAQGLSDWSVSLGAVREDYGLRSWSYGSEPVASGNVRYGLSDRLTLQGSAEASDALRQGGAGASWLVARAGVVNASHARSSLHGRHGTQTSLGYAWNSRRFNASVDTTRTRGEYRDLASLYGSRPPRVSERGLLGVHGPRMGSLSASYVRLVYPDSDRAGGRFAGLFWSRSFGAGWSATASVNRNLDDSGDYSAFVSLAVPLAARRQASASYQRNAGRDSLVAELSQPLPGDGGTGWRVQARGGDEVGGLAEVTTLGQRGSLGAGAARAAGTTFSYARASGSLVWVRGAVLPTRTVNDAFAVVSTSGVPGVPVMLENRLVGHTGDQGWLLVPRLNAWQLNRLSIDPMDLPAHFRALHVEQQAVPREGSATAIDFVIDRVRAALLVLHDEQGRVLPVGAQVFTAGGAPAGRVGHGGELFVESLQPANSLWVETPGGRCRVTFAYPDEAEGIPRIGPLLCRLAGGEE